MTILLNRDKGSVSFKSIALVVMLLLVLGGLVFGFDKARSFLSKAAEGGCSPKGNPSTDNVTPNSADIVFSTNEACSMAVAYGISKEAILLETKKETMSVLNHRIRVSELLPKQTYYYQIIVDGKKTGSAYSFVTKPTVETIVDESGVTPTVAVTVAPTIAPTAVPTGYALGEVLTIEDFKKNIGKVTAKNKKYDINGDGEVNGVDIKMYQGSGESQ